MAERKARIRENQPLNLGRHGHGRLKCHLCAARMPQQMHRTPGSCVLTELDDALNMSFKTVAVVFQHNLALGFAAHSVGRSATQGLGPAAWQARGDDMEVCRKLRHLPSPVTVVAE